jgi:hypothetical protein
MFLNKKPSVVTRVLDFADCPTHSTIHDVETYPIYYHSSLQSLTAPHLQSIALTLASHKMSSHTKKNATVAILDHFFAWCQQLLRMDDAGLFAELSNTSLPIGCI